MEEKNNKKQSLSREEMLEEIKEKYMEGYNAKQIGEIYNISVSMVKKLEKLLRDRGEIPERPMLSILREQRLEMVEKLFNAGYNNSVIAEKTGVKPNTIRNDLNVLSSQGKIVRRKKATKEEIDEIQKQIQQKYLDKKTYKEIANELKISEHLVRNYVVEMKRNNSLPVQKKKRRISPEVVERREKIKEIGINNKTYKEIADELGATVATIANDIKIMRKEGDLPYKYNTKKKKTASTKNEEGQKKKMSHEDKARQLKDKELQVILKTIKKYKKGEGEQQAINFVKMHQNSQYLTEEGRKFLSGLVEKAENAQAKRIIELLRKGRSLEEIKRITKYEDDIIFKIYEQFINRTSEEEER